MDLQELNNQIIKEFRANGGNVGGQFQGAPLLLLTTKGAKSGKTRVNPLAYLNDAGRHVIIASYAGADSNPPWYHNLIANPVVEVEVGKERFKARARSGRRTRSHEALPEDDAGDAGVRGLREEDHAQNSGDRTDEGVISVPSLRGTSAWLPNAAPNLESFRARTAATRRRIRSCRTSRLRLQNATPNSCSDV